MKRRLYTVAITWSQRTGRPVVETREVWADSSEVAIAKAAAGSLRGWMPRYIEQVTVEESD